MEGVFLREEVWFEQAEEEASELLLPIMVGSACSTSSLSSTRSPATATWWTTWSRRFPPADQPVPALPGAGRKSPPAHRHALRSAAVAQREFARALVPGCAIASRPWVS